MLYGQSEDKQTDQDENELENAQDEAHATEQDVEQALLAAHEKADKHWEMFVRSQAELENVRRRAEKDRRSDRPGPPRPCQIGCSNSDNYS